MASNIERFRERYARYSTVLGRGESSANTFSVRVTEIGAQAIYYSTVYGCVSGCTDGDKGVHKPLCLKARLNA